MISRGMGVAVKALAGGLRAALPLAVLLGLTPGPVSAQLFSDRPPPIPPASVPDAPPTGPAMNLAPPSGPGAGPNLPPALNQPTLTQPGGMTQPSIANSPPPVAAPANQAVLSL